MQKAKEKGLAKMQSISYILEISESYKEYPIAKKVSAECRK